MPVISDIPLTEQWNLFGLVSAGEIGVNLIASGILVTRKSASMVIGIGLNITRWTQAQACACCNLRETYHYKVIE